MEQTERRKPGRPRKDTPVNDDERRTLSEGEKIVIEWVALTADPYSEREAWRRAYAALRREKRGGAKESTIAEAASRFSNQRIVRDYLAQCRERMDLRRRQERERIEAEIFSDDGRIKEFVERRMGHAMPERQEGKERTLEGAVSELYDLADQINDPKDKANIIMKIAEFGGLKHERDEERHRNFYIPMVCRSCNLYKLGEEVLRAEARKADPEGSPNAP